MGHQIRNWQITKYRPRQVLQRLHEMLAIWFIALKNKKMKFFYNSMLCNISTLMSFVNSRIYASNQCHTCTVNNLPTDTTDLYLQTEMQHCKEWTFIHSSGAHLSTFFLWNFRIIWNNTTITHSCSVPYDTLYHELILMQFMF